MNSWAKKSLLVYFLFLIMTVTGLSPQASESLTKSEVDYSPTSKEEVNIIEPSTSAFKEEAKNDVQKVAMGVTPVSIEIPVIGENAKVIEVGQTEDGQMEAPESIYEVGWYAPGTKPGNVGNSVLAGHVDGYDKPGVFYNLKKLKIGDEIHVTGADGKILTFTVVETASYVSDESPLNKIFGESSKAMLNLITCTGVFDNKSGLYDERLVVYTELVEKP